MEPVSWTTRDEMPPCGHFIEDEVVGPKNERRFERELLACPYFADHPFRPAVLMACTRGICAKTEVIKPGKRDRAVPEGITPEQFQALKAGQYWLEIIGAA